MALWRTGLAAALAVAVWFLSVYAQVPPAALGPDAPAADFSAMRARAVLTRLQGPARPHPAGSAENAALHGRLRAELAALGVKVTSQRRFSCFSGARWGAMECAEIENLIGEVAAGEGKAIVMMAHMDSVPAGPGAGDDGSGVATILETIRALKARGLHSRHPIVAAFTDGEEFGLLGAAALMRDPAFVARTGMVINMDPRGSTGQSLLFQTSPGNGPMIDLYAHSVPRYASSSLNAEVYRFLPNDTDLTPVLQAGLPGYNFAFVGGVANYHTPNDTVANLDPRTLQAHGDNLLGLMGALESADFAGLKGGDAAYLDVLGVWLPRLPMGWMLPLALLVFAGIASAGLRAGADNAPWRKILAAGLMPPALLLGCVAIGFALHFIASTISGAADPSFAHPWALRLGLAFGVWAVTLLAARLGGGAFACWLWLAGLGVVTAALLPGLSPFFVFPSLVAALTLPFVSGRRALLLIPALAALIVWLGLTALGEQLLGLMVHPLFTVSAALALIGLVPLLPRLEQRQWTICVGACAALALACAVIAGLLPSYTADQPERLNLRYVEQAGRALWAADPARHFPPALREAGHFPVTARLLPGLGHFYVTDAGRARFAPPSASVTREGEQVSLHLHGSPDAQGVSLSIPEEAGLTSAAVGDWKFPVKPGGSFIIACATAGCRDATIVLDLKSAAPVTLILAEQRPGLPPDGAALIAARGASAVPSQFGDQTLLTAEVKIPGR